MQAGEGNREAVDIIRRQGRASVSMLQRKLRIGYTRASRLVDVMEELVKFTWLVRGRADYLGGVCFQQGGQPVERRAVADAGRHGDDRLRDQPAEHRGQGALEAGAADHHGQ